MDPMSVGPVCAVEGENPQRGFTASGSADPGPEPAGRFGSAPAFVKSHKEGSCLGSVEMCASFYFREPFESGEQQGLGFTKA